MTHFQVLPPTGPPGRGAEPFESASVPRPLPHVWILTTTTTVARSTSIAQFSNGAKQGLILPSVVKEPSKLFPNLWCNLWQRNWLSEFTILAQQVQNDGAEQPIQHCQLAAPGLNTIHRHVFWFLIVSPYKKGNFTFKKSGVPTYLKIQKIRQIRPTIQHGSHQLRQKLKLLHLGRWKLTSFSQSPPFPIDFHLHYPLAPS